MALALNLGSNKLAGTKAAGASKASGRGACAVVASLRCLSLHLRCIRPHWFLHAQMAAPTHRITVPPVLVIDFTILGPRSAGPLTAS